MTRSVFAPLACALFFSLQAQALHVVIDPGHGGIDKGATRGKIYESDITLKVARYLEAHLEKDPNFSVYLTRRGNTKVSLSQRTKAASKKGDLLISIHVNTSIDSRAKGVEVYFQNQLPPDEESLFLAKMENLDSHGEKGVPPEISIKGAPKNKNDVYYILQDLARNFRHKMSGELSKALVKSWTGPKRSKHSSIRQAPFYVISNTSIPAVLVELGYLSNNKESLKLTSAAYQKNLARGLYKGISRFRPNLLRFRSTLQ